MEDAENLVRFTAKELLARLDVKLDELNRKLDEKMQNVEGRIEKLELAVAQNDVRGATRDNNEKDHEGRIRSLEKKLWIAAGAASAAGGTVGVIGKLIIGG